MHGRTASAPTAADAAAAERLDGLKRTSKLKRKVNPVGGELVDSFRTDWSDPGEQGDTDYVPGDDSEGDGN